MNVIDKLISAIDGEIFRPNLYSVEILLPTTGPLTVLSSGFQNLLTCSATTIPADEIVTAAVPFYGREIHFPIDRNISNWSATFFDSWNLKYFSLFKTWNGVINDYLNNTAAKKFSLYDISATIKINLLTRQSDKEDGQLNVVGTVSAFGVYPTKIGEMVLAADATDQAAFFDVEFVINGGVSQFIRKGFDTTQINDIFNQPVGQALV